MGDLVNLNRFRKRTEREASAKEADANRARFGLTKTEKKLNAERILNSEKMLDQHRIDDGEAS